MILRADGYASEGDGFDSEGRRVCLGGRQV